MAQLSGILELDNIWKPVQISNGNYWFNLFYVNKSLVYVKDVKYILLPE
jgi:hypothetical protein